MAVIVTMAAIAAWAILTHRISYVVTYGVSMQPTYHAGGLVIVLKSDSYEVGQIAAYHGSGRVEVIHRIIGGDADSGYILKGDNNESADVVEPTADEIIGRAILHVPRMGSWLAPVLSPTGLGMLGFLLVSGKATKTRNRRDVPRGRRKKRVKSMAGGGGSWAAAATMLKTIGRLHPTLRALAAAAAACGILGLTLGVLGWMKPATQVAPATGEPGQSITFAYSAEVSPSAAYDGTTVYSPDPIFRKLAGVVDLSLDYRGKPGRIMVDARLAASNGWHKTIQLSQQQQFTTDRHRSTVQLDLNALLERASAAGKAIGTELGDITVAIKVRVLHDDGTAFEPQLVLQLDQMRLSLAGGPETLVVNQSGTTADPAMQPRQIGVLGHDLLRAEQARTYAVYLIITALAAAGLIAWMALGHVPLRTRAQIQRRYPHLIVPVEPMASPPGKPVVTVDTFPALVKLAEKYGQMILTWTRPDGADDFVVRDEGILYRYRVEPDAATSTTAPDGPAPGPARPDSGPTAEPAADRTADPAPEPAPIMSLPIAPEPSPTPGGEGDTPAGDEAASAGNPPAKRPAARKRATKTTATKTATAKAAAEVASPRNEPEPEPPASVAEPEPQPSPAANEEQQAETPQKRPGRRKSRSRRTTEPTADEPQTTTDPATEAREAMTDLAERNAPIVTPEPGAPAEDGRRKAAAAPRPAPVPEHHQEPIYDFLPVAKRQPASPDDVDEPES